jgi:hypothetical protein
VYRSLPEQMAGLVFSFGFGGVSVSQEDIEENAYHVADECSSRTAANQRLRGAEFKPVSERDCDRKSRHGENQSYQ